VPSFKSFDFQFILSLKPGGGSVSVVTFSTKKSQVGIALSEAVIRRRQMIHDGKTYFSKYSFSRAYGKTTRLRDKTDAAITDALRFCRKHLDYIVILTDEF
jgi:hypothetical protein